MVFLQISRRTNKSVRGVFLDIAKAFGCANYQILLNKLEHYGVRGIARSLFCSYLSNRLQYTVNTEEQFVSEQLLILIVVPQDSVLRRFFFLVYINDLPNCTKSKVVLYADDSVLCALTKTYLILKKK